MRPSILALLGLALAGCPATNYGAADGPRYGGTAPPRVDEDGGAIRVVTFNIRFGQEPELALAELERAGQSDADVFLLQEMDEAGTRWLAEALGTSWVFYPASIHGERDFGNAILTRWPLLDDGKVLLPHRAPLDGRLRIAVTARIEGPNGLLFVTSVHNETVLLPLAGRIDQARAILDDAERRYGELPGVIAGDFNTAEPHAVTATEALFTTYGYSAAAPASGVATADSPLGAVSLDRVFSRGLDVVEGGVGPGLGASDHRLVWARLNQPGG